MNNVSVKGEYKVIVENVTVDQFTIRLLGPMNADFIERLHELVDQVGVLAPGTGGVTSKVTRFVSVRPVLEDDSVPGAGNRRAKGGDGSAGY